MATGIAPLFTTAPRVKLRMEAAPGVFADVAFAIGLNINVSVNIQPVSIVGKFGPVSLEPTLYNTVTGTMQIIRLVSKESISAQLDAATKVNADNSFNIITKATTSTNESGQEVTTSQENVEVNTGENSFDSNNPLAQVGLHRHMNPRTVLLSRTFNLDLYMRIPDSNNTNIKAIMGGDPSTIAENDLSTEVFETVPWFRIEKCRLTSRNTNIALGQLVNEPVSFQGLLATPFTGADSAIEPTFSLDQGQDQQP